MAEVFSIAKLGGLDPPAANELDRPSTSRDFGEPIFSATILGVSMTSWGVCRGEHHINGILNGILMGYINDLLDSMGAFHQWIIGILWDDIGDNRD